MSKEVSRRNLLKTSAVGGVSVMAGESACGFSGLDYEPNPLQDLSSCLTPAEDFFTVARGKPKPHTLKGDALVEARMTPDSWRLEIVTDQNLDPPVVNRKSTAEKQLLIEDGTALDYEKLLKIGKTKNVKLIKTIQCLNIDRPLGQGLWEGVPLRDVLNLCGKTMDVRRIYFWGFHNNSPEQLFQSSLSYSRAIDHAPDDPPVFLAYRLNGKPISPIRGGPVRMIVPWAYGFKSIKWLQKIVLSNDPRANDTYANKNNDPDAPMKTAAYLDKKTPRKFKKGEAIEFGGAVVAGLSGLEKVQFLLRKNETPRVILPYDHPEILNAEWKTATILSPPKNWKSVLPSGVSPTELIGFDRQNGTPKQWPLRYGMASWKLTLEALKPGRYELRVRSVDRNGFAQPEPRTLLKSGRNGIQPHSFEVV